MKFTLTRTECTSLGQFGVLVDESGDIVAYTMEHAYPCADSFKPKVPAGSYICALGQHQLSTGGPFQAYELQGVPDHTGILIHPGNTQMDSHGCILIGLQRGQINGMPAVLHSKAAFEKFMGQCNGAASIELDVVEA